MLIINEFYLLNTAAHQFSTSKSSVRTLWELLELLFVFKIHFFKNRLKPSVVTNLHWPSTQLVPIKLNHSYDRGDGKKQPAALEYNLEDQRDIVKSFQIQIMKNPCNNSLK